MSRNMICDCCIYSGRPTYDYPCSKCDMVIGSLSCMWEYEKILTNGDKIRDMSDEELAVWLCSRFDNCSSYTCPGANYCNGEDGKANGLVKWLKQPAEE
jgi:hypothetical protein